MEKDEVLYKFGRCLAQARKHNNITQDRVCEVTNMMKNTISDLERGKSDSRLYTIYCYSQAANISLAEVFSNFENIPLKKSPELQELINLLYNEDKKTLKTVLEQTKFLLSAIKKS